jgi:signal transduction histidine kinase
VLDTGEPQRDVGLDGIGRQRVHGFPLRLHDVIIGVACVVDDDGARRELFVRCAMALFDGYRRTEAALLERERQALDEARRANRERDQFLAVVAHELRSPMTSILLWEQVLRTPGLDDATRTAALDAIHESAAGQALLVGDLVDVSRAINGKLRIDREATSMLRVLAMAIEDARPHVQRRQVELVTEIDPELGYVLGDSRRLRQVLDNLLSNAMNWTQQGRISVHARQSEDTVTIDVRDTGRGIPADRRRCVEQRAWPRARDRTTARRASWRNAFGFERRPRTRGAIHGNASTNAGKHRGRVAAAAEHRGHSRVGCRR